jgi:hypothetical protein
MRLESNMPIVVGEDRSHGIEVILEGSLAANRGDDLFVANARGPAIRLIYGGGDSAITARELVSHWSEDTIYLGYGGQAAGQSRYALILFVQPTWRGNWLIHYQLSRQTRREDAIAA